MAIADIYGPPAATGAVGLQEGAAALTEYLQNGGQNLDPATTAWCAAFVNSALEQSGVQGTGKLNARSYLDWGQPVDQPMPGDVAVFSRGDPNGWQGHVGFFQGIDPATGKINVLGGNQSNMVSVAGYDPSTLLGYRRAPGASGPQTPAPPGLGDLMLAQAPQAAQLDPNAEREARASAEKKRRAALFDMTSLYG